MITTDSFLILLKDRSTESIMYASSTDWMLDRAMKLTCVREASDLLQKNPFLASVLVNYIKELTSTSTDPNNLPKLVASLGCAAGVNSFEIRDALGKIAGEMPQTSLVFDLFKLTIKLLDERLTPLEKINAEGVGIFSEEEGEVRTSPDKKSENYSHLEKSESRTVGSSDQVIDLIEYKRKRASS